MFPGCRTGEDGASCIYNLVLSYPTPVSVGINKGQLQFQGTCFYLRSCHLSSPCMNLYHFLPEISDPFSLWNDLYRQPALCGTRTGTIQEGEGRLS